MTRWMFMKQKLTCIWIKSSCWGIPNGFPRGAELAELTINQDLRPSLFSRIVGCIEVWIFFGFKYLKIKDFNSPKSNWTNHRKKNMTHKFTLEVWIKKPRKKSSLTPPLKWEETSPVSQELPPCGDGFWALGLWPGFPHFPGRHTLGVEFPGGRGRLTGAFRMPCGEGHWRYLWWGTPSRLDIREIPEVDEVDEVDHPVSYIY